MNFGGEDSVVKSGRRTDKTHPTTLKERNGCLIEKDEDGQVLQVEEEITTKSIVCALSSADVVSEKRRLHSFFWRGGRHEETRKQRHLFQRCRSLKKLRLAKVRVWRELKVG
jgi:hypothetical protein